jgi:hypothetical protein
VNLAHDLAMVMDPPLFAEAVGINCDPWQHDLLSKMPRRALLCCSRQSGKSTITAIVALHVALFTTGALCVIVSPSQRQSAEMLRTIKMLYAKLVGVPALASESVLKIEFESGSRILALPSTESTIRGLSSVALLVVDEAARVPADLIAACKPMLAVSDGHLIMLSTPAGRRGTFFDLWHATDDSDEWLRVAVPASRCPRISAAFLESEKKELGQVRYSEEYELAWVDNDTMAFSSSIIADAFTNEVAPLWK